MVFDKFKMATWKYLVVNSLSLDLSPTEYVNNELSPLYGKFLCRLTCAVECIAFMQRLGSNTNFPFIYKKFVGYIWSDMEIRMPVCSFENQDN